MVQITERLRSSAPAASSGGRPRGLGDGPLTLLIEHVVASPTLIIAVSSGPLMSSPRPLASGPAVLYDVTAADYHRDRPLRDAYMAFMLIITACQAVQ